MPIGKARGFTYLGLLLLIAIGGIALAAVGQIWHTESQREREKELLFIGEQYAKAIDSYFESSPGVVRQYPASLQELLLDKRFPVIRRHLRKLYRDPVTGGAEWGLVKEQGRIIGVYSLSKARPLKQDGFADSLATFVKAESYRQWQFVRSGAAGASETSPSLSASELLPAASAAATSTAQSTTSTAASPESNQKADIAACQSALAVENTQCRNVCGNPSNTECRSCISRAFSNYRSCLHGA